MNIKENYLRTCRGEATGTVPNYMQSVTFFSPQVLADPNSQLYGMLEACAGQPAEKLVCKDCYGIPWQLDEFGPMVVPGTALFEEMDDWRGHFLIPDLSGYTSEDWDRMCREDSAFLEPDKAVQVGYYGQFTQLYNAMGFYNAMVAVAEEPEEVKVLFQEMTDFICAVQEEVMKRVHVDSICIYDDLANSTGTFISRQTYQELVKPFHKQIFDAARKLNPDVCLEMHCCGKCELFMDDYVEIGSQVWQPAQPVNDLKAIRKKYGTDLVFNGGWDNFTVFGKDDITETEVRRIIRDWMNDYGKNGGLIFWDQQVGSSEDMVKKVAWMTDEVEHCHFNSDSQ